ncbi:MAG: hypothetical protein PHQ28_10690 [Mycobacterium sp.]|nr:hypothetical protein [Mycobacterium sp.]
MDHRYRITDSKTGSAAINASLTITGPVLTWLLVNDRGQMQIAIAPTLLTTARNWFWISLIKQFLDGDDEIAYLSTSKELDWIRQNGDRVEQLFSDPSTLDSTCAKLAALRRVNADRYWSRWREEQGLEGPGGS